MTAKADRNVGDVDLLVIGGGTLAEPPRGMSRQTASDGRLGKTTSFYTTVTGAAKRRWLRVTEVLLRINAYEHHHVDGDHPDAGVRGGDRGFGRYLPRVLRQPGRQLRSTIGGLLACALVPRVGGEVVHDGRESPNGDRERGAGRSANRGGRPGSMRQLPTRRSR